ncbi:hypothetical protein SYYSPA8_16395 [Streptomyces yaizuensis]|uniref:Uncharacterized protein n=1 Tax=Streptomyces yaizuensis TaxID=2989713 RepID=A0ABQ5NZX3_9ACTN|nr:hypothetical protein SYYSPA8_16395 [Streptomyces sp. YSPA8]
MARVVRVRVLPAGARARLLLRVLLLVRVRLLLRVVGLGPALLLVRVRLAEVLRFAVGALVAAAVAPGGRVTRVATGAGLARLARLRPPCRLLPLGMRRHRLLPTPVPGRCLLRSLLLRAVVVPAASDPESSHVLERTRSRPAAWERVGRVGLFAADL